MNSECTPVISIILATLNSAETLINCLESIIIQKDQSVELLVIDGGSLDGSLSILHDYGRYIDYQISEADCGIYDAWNKGIARARGSWILFVGADDTLEPDALHHYRDFLATHDATDIDYICAKNTSIGTHGTELKVFGKPWQWEQFRRSMDLAHVASLHNKSLFHEVGLYGMDMKICGDYELLLRKGSRLRTLYLDTCLARVAIGGMSYSLSAIREAHAIRTIHSGLSLPELYLLYLWQIILFLRHRCIHFS
jgi:glycosyltransferase involved in cell wall biosynthesis